jgi:mono/diheme cytochrome c family protein
MSARTAALAGIVLAWAAAAGLAQSPKAPAAKSAEPTRVPYAQAVAPFITKYCVECHGEKVKKGKLALHAYKTDAEVVRDAKTWEKVLALVRSGDMPPAGRNPRPTRPEAEALVNRLESVIYKVDCNGPADPGRVTIRRLNRSEYNNTIRDLTGVNYKPADDFPADDVGYGFDNIGDLLSLPPILAEKYLAAAEQIIDRALAARPRSLNPTYEAEELKVGGGIRRQGTQAIALTTAEGEVFVEHRFPADGEYGLRVRSFGNTVANEPPKLSLRLDGKEVGSHDVKTAEDKAQVYETRARVTAGVHKVSAGLVNPGRDPGAPAGKFGKDFRRQSRSVSVVYIEIAGGPGAAAGPGPLVIPRQSGQNRREWARGNVERFAERAFRRPITRAESDRLMRFVDDAERDGDGLEAGIRTAYQAILVSPHFLFRIEVDKEPNNPRAIHAISEFELATRLSYFLWSSMPDPELYDLAKRGELRKGDALEKQVRRMLADKKARALTENFAGQWLQLRNLRTVAPDAKLFPAFNDRLRADMLKETEAYFEHVVAGDRSVLEFLDSDYTFLNERLAAHYGVAGVRGEEFRQVKLPAGGPRGGLLTHGSILTITSNPTRTSPVKRGKWVLEEILGTPPPPPPPGADDLRDDEKAVLSGSLRQRMEQHRRNPNCAVCHTKMDALGFGLENFDPVGAFRTRDGRFNIDPSGTLPDGRTFAGPAELRRILVQDKDAFARAFAGKLLTYALGRGLEPFDKCAVDRICASAGRNNYRFSTFVLEIVGSAPFQQRRGKEL